MEATRYRIDKPRSQDLRYGPNDLKPVIGGAPEPIPDASSTDEEEDDDDGDGGDAVAAHRRIRRPKLPPTKRKKKMPMQP